MYKYKKAFTLVELIVVIAILAILGTIAFISLQGYSIQARDTTRISDISSIKTGLELFQLESGKYPKATNGVNITYSGAIVWNQGTFGETVYVNIGKLDKIPLDPVTSEEYTYSVISNGNQYELGGILEGDDITFYQSQPPLKLGNEQLQVKAAETIATAYVTGNYNGKIVKSLSGTICDILSLPTIIANDVETSTDLLEIANNKRLVYNGYKNLPSSFKTSKFKYDGGFDFSSNNILAYTDNQSCEPLMDKTDYTARINLLKGLQNSYSGTIVQNEGEIKNILDFNIDVNNLNQEIVNYSANFINNIFGSKIEAGGIIVNYSNCQSGVQSGYNYGAILHYQQESIIKSENISNGIRDYLAQAYCLDGTISIINEATNIVCNTGYVEQIGVCVQDVCNSTVPINAHSTATSQTVNQTWTYNTSAGVCTFVCDSNYAWNGSSCESQWSGDATSGYLFKDLNLVEQYPTSCNNLLVTSTWKNTFIGSPWNGTKFNDGIYWIKPDNNPAYKAYCDMSNSGGGWTLLGSIKKGGSIINWSTAIDSTYSNLDYSGKDSPSNWGKVDSKLNSWLNVGISTIIVKEGNNYDSMNFTSISPFTSLLQNSSLSSYTNFSLNFNTCNNTFGYCWSPSIGNVLRTTNNTPCSNGFRNVNQKGINLVWYHDGYCNSGGNSYVNRGFFITDASVDGAPEISGVFEQSQSIQRIVDGVSFWGK